MQKIEYPISLGLACTATVVIAKSRPKVAEANRIQLVQPPDLAIRREQVG